jgi:predicted RNase H-like nuclease (RuvC/YqgF family)
VNLDAYSKLDDINIKLNEENEMLKKQIEGIQSNCISLSLHESRMKRLDDEIARLRKALTEADKILETIGKG